MVTLLNDKVTLILQFNQSLALKLDYGDYFPTPQSTVNTDKFTLNSDIKNQ